MKWGFSVVIDNDFIELFKNAFFCWYWISNKIIWLVNYITVLLSYFNCQKGKYLQERKVVRQPRLSHFARWRCLLALRVSTNQNLIVLHVHEVRLHFSRSALLRFIRLYLSTRRPAFCIPSSRKFDFSLSNFISS